MSMKLSLSVSIVHIVSFRWSNRYLSVNQCHAGVPRSLHLRDYNFSRFWKKTATLYMDSKIADTSLLDAVIQTYLDIFPGLRWMYCNLALSEMLERIDIFSSRLIRASPCPRRWSSASRLLARQIDVLRVVLEPYTVRAIWRSIL